MPPPAAGSAISLRAFARLLGVSLPAVQRAIADGRITSATHARRGWKITDAEQAKAEWQANTRPRARAAGTEHARNGHDRPAPATLAAATLRERIARAKLIELDYERKKRALIPQREVELYLSTMVVSVRTAILGVPSRAKQRLPHLTVADLAILDELQREALEGLATTPSEKSEA